MITQRRKSHIKSRVILLLFAAMLVLSFIHGNGVFANADDGAGDKLYTDVVTDLSKSADFDISAYPEKPGESKEDYAIDVIQIAESENNELFMYCYIPCMTVELPEGKQTELTPTEVAIAVTSDLNDMTHLLHGLTEVSRYKTLFKYVVQGVTVDVSKPIRYYSVSMLQRKWSSFVPGETEDADLVKPERVAKLWTVETTADGVKYSQKHKETVEILNPIAGAVRYFKDQVPANWGTDAVDSHFIAFDTDLPIDDLLEADVSYIPAMWESDVDGKNGGYAVAYGIMHYEATTGKKWKDLSAGDQLTLIEDWYYSKLKNDSNKYAVVSAWADEYVRSQTPTVVTIKKDEKYTFDTGGWTSNKDTYTWNRIQDVDGFKNSLQGKNIVNMSGNYTAEDIASRKWILRYRETTWDDPDSTDEAILDFGQYRSTHDVDIVVLRLKFETAGQVYNLGTVSDKVDQTEYIKGNTPKTFWQALREWFEKYWWVIVVIIVAIVLLIVLAPFMPTILSGLVSALRLLLKGLWWLLKHLCIALWWIVSAPFRLIKWIIDKVRERKEGAPS